MTKRVFRGGEGGGVEGLGENYYLLLFVLQFQPRREGDKTLGFFMDKSPRCFIPWCQY